MMFLVAALFIFIRLDAMTWGLAYTRTRTNLWNSPRSSLTSPCILYNTATDIGANTLSIGIDDRDYTTAKRAADANQFRADLDAAGLSQCHGMLHATGCRSLSDIGKLTQLTADQLMSMGVDDSHRLIIYDLMDVPQENNMYHQYDMDGRSSNAMISTIVPGPALIANKDFNFEVVCAENDIFKGRLFTPEQCNQLKRMSEYHAYHVNSEWMGMSCKSIAECIPSTEDIFRELFNALYSVYPGMRAGSLRYESSNEPHLVRYSGEAKGAPLHTDTTHKSLTLNVLLSDNSDFGGGGTYIQAIDKRIKLDQGEMLIHPGNLEHAGADISFGMRYLLVAFLECEWDDAQHAKGSAPPL